jgi:hypothetical protein
MYNLRTQKCIICWAGDHNSITSYEEWSFGGVSWLQNYFDGTTTEAFSLTKKSHLLGCSSTTFSAQLSLVLFICKTKSRLRRRHCGLARHFKTDPTETVALCFGYAKTLFWRRRHCGLAHHFKTDPTKTVALCFGYAKTLCWQADGIADEQDICDLARVNSKQPTETV